MIGATILWYKSSISSSKGILNTINSWDKRNREAIEFRMSAQNSSIEFLRFSFARYPADWYWYRSSFRASISG
jgi:hypothetical protein